MVTYIIHFSLTHLSFRLPELISIADLHGFGNTIKIILAEDLPDNTVPPRAIFNEDGTSNQMTPAPRPFVVVELENEEQARILAGRFIPRPMKKPNYFRAIYELWAHAPSYDLLHGSVQNPSAKLLWEPLKTTPFKFAVTAIHYSFAPGRMQAIMDSFSYMKYEKIDLYDPEATTLWVCEEYEDRRGMHTNVEKEAALMVQVYFGRLIADGTARKLISHFNVKKRAYYGTTSMEAEMSLLMANQSQCSTGKMIYDPFVGTGSMLYRPSPFPSIEDRASTGIFKAASQYGVADRILDCATFDVTNHPWRRGEIFDAIVTDPPCGLRWESERKDGVRAGAKRIGSSVPGKPLGSEPKVLQDGVIAHTKPSYIPPMRPYEISDLAYDLVKMAQYLLRPGGRLVFFLPTVSEDYTDVDLPTCEGMSIVGNSVQDFGKWGRRLITMEKDKQNMVIPEAPRFEDRAWRKKEQEAGLAASIPEPLADGNNEEAKEAEHVPAHHSFRDKYFMGFKKS
ncbi:hypothetical protein FRB97_007199 [Tulasnella sp. 331]|nr:hypothetical protein FRB97_007199 [Tulasnella sp. 331]